MKTINLFLDLSIETIAILTAVFLVVSIIHDCVQFFQIPRSQLKTKIKNIKPTAVTAITQTATTLTPTAMADPWELPLNCINGNSTAKLEPCLLPIASYGGAFATTTVLPKLKLLPPAKSVVNLTELNSNIDFDKLTLIKCKKIALLLGIRQTVNKKAVPVALLRKQIQTKLILVNQKQLTIVQLLAS